MIMRRGEIDSKTKFLCNHPLNSEKIFISMKREKKRDIYDHGKRRNRLLKNPLIIFLV
jgi:hypothetical protein